MKLQNTLAMGFGLALLSISSVHAAETLSNPINEDLFYANGVQFQGITESSEGVASVSLEGTGSVTVGSQATGGFPRVAVSAGSTITSTRTWPAETVPKTSWDGQFTAPGNGRLPSVDEVTFTYATNRGNEFTAVEAFVWGLSNEVFTFSSPARIVLPVDEADGQRLWVAPGNGTTWTVNDTNEYCVVDSGLCYLELSTFGDIALVKQVYNTCPRETVLNGNVGSIPNCIVTCDSGYYIDAEGDECLVDDFSEGDLGDSGLEELGGLDDFSEADQEELYEFAQDYGIDPLELIREVPGAVKERGSADSIRYYLEEYADLTEEELATVRHLNTGYLSRNPRTVAEQLAGEAKEDPAIVRQKEDSFISYLLQMRNQFAGNNTALSSTTEGEEASESVAEGELEDGEDEDSVAAADGFHSSGGLLPSTGPGLFITIAIMGFLLMLFGGIRRN